MSYLYLAFFMGLFGSVHCVGMCGPLVLALPAGRSATWSIVLNRMIYQVGRVLTYALLGILFGLLGNSLAVKGWQQMISIGTGLFLILMAVFNLFSGYFSGFVRLQQWFIQPVIRQMGVWLYRPGGSLFAGALNGLLPCGMVYMALAAALNADTALRGGLFMLFFGMGTVPMMAAVSLFGIFFGKKINWNVAKWLPVLLLIMGCWFLLRGANLDIPFLSPLIYPEGAIECAFRPTACSDVADSNRVCG